MDPARTQYSGYWLVCRYCQRAFRDKLDLFCHQVNDHPEYRDELNGQQRSNVVAGSSSNVQQVVYADQRTERMKQQPTYVQQQPQQQGTTWYQQSADQSQNDGQYYTTPVEYYVVLPNQSQTQMTGVGNATYATIGDQVVNVVQHQNNQHQVVHPSNSHVQQVQQVRNLVSVQNEDGTDWSKLGIEVIETDPNSLGGVNKDDVDYFCWKCKVKFGNATAYIAHSGTCFPKHDYGNHGNVSSAESVASSSDRSSTQGSRKRTPKKAAPARVQPPPPSRRPDPVVESKPKKVSVQSPKPMVTPSPSQSTGRGRKRPATNTVTATIVVTQESSPDAGPSINGTKPGGRLGNGIVCTYCGTQFPKNEELLVHVQVCKSKRNPYESYQYKCIMCKESFDVYLDYKRHIATHTGEVRYS